jgi:hypothetical protein
MSWFFTEFCSSKRVNVWSRYASVRDLIDNQHPSFGDLECAEQRFGFLFRRYEAEYHWWELMFFWRKLSLISTQAFFSRPLDQCLLMMLCIVPGMLGVVRLCSCWMQLTRGASNRLVSTLETWNVISRFPNVLSNGATCTTTARCALSPTTARRWTSWWGGFTRTG